MDMWKFFSVTRKYHTVDNPFNESKLDQLIDALHLPSDARVLDIACGNAEMLCRIAECYPSSSGTGIEVSPFRSAAAHARIVAGSLSERVSVYTMSGSDFTASDESFDSVSCIGASWIWSGFSGTLNALTRWAKPGGVVIVGEPYWQTAPPPDYVKEEGWSANLFATHAGNIAAGERLGLVPLLSIASSLDDWDRYEGLTWLAAADFARDYPEDPDVADVQDQVARARRLYLTWGRDSLGWAIYLFRKP